MVVDTSAVLAILLQEEDAARFAEAIGAVERPMISAASVVEAGIVLIARYGDEARADLEALLEAGSLRVEAVTAEQGAIALDAFRAFGKGRGQDTALNFGALNFGALNFGALNFGACFAYALAKASGQPLLFKGEDVFRTDVRRVL